MTRFVAGAVACLLLVTGGLFWWQGQARNQRLDDPVKDQVAQSPLTLPVGDESAVGKAPPMPPEAPEEDREARRFNRYDRDRDDIITRLELMSSRTAAFKKLDTDGNNLLSFEEWAVSTSDRFKEADANSDGRLTRSEFATTAPKRTAPKPACKC